MNKRFTNNFLWTTALCISMALPAAVMATVTNSELENGSTGVIVSDLDLSSEQGVSTLYQRLQTGASKVCGIKDTHVTGSRIASQKIRQQHKRCATDALNKAVQNINNEKLTDLHRRNS